MFYSSNNAFSQHGGFILPNKNIINQDYKNKLKRYKVKKKFFHSFNAKPTLSRFDSHPSLTPVKMKALYETGLYQSFRNVLKVKGFKEYFIPRLFCIAKLESSFNSKARNFNTNGTIDIGLFQINSIWRKECPKTLYSIENNIDCAKIVLEKQGLSAWVTYNNYGHICEKSLRI